MIFSNRKRSGISATETGDMKKSRFLLFPLLILSLQFSFPDTSNAQLSKEIGTIIETSRASNAFWAVQIRDSQGNLIEDLNGNKLIRPASNLKLLTSAALLSRLGPDFYFETTLYGRGEQLDNVWIGDLVIEGVGDPSIDGIFYNDDPLHVFEKWVNTLISRGISRIEGDIFGFDGLFDDVPYPRGWEWDDLSYYYAPKISALSFNSNVVNLEVTAEGPIGSHPEIAWSPFNTPYVKFINEQIITPPGSRFEESYRRILGTNTIILRSTLPQGYYEKEPLTVSNPSFYFLDTLLRYMELRGIEVMGSIFVESNYYSWSNEGLVPIDRHRSEPLYRLIERLNQESDNFYTEMLIKKLGYLEYNVQGTTELGLLVLKKYMQEMQFDTSAVLLRDGSGMAPATLLNITDFNRFLYLIRGYDYFPHLYSSMAVAGEIGTLSHRFRNTPLRGNFVGKTGFVSGVRALSGYLTTASGEDLTVSLVTNNYSVRTSHVDFIHQQILDYLFNNY